MKKSSTVFVGNIDFDIPEEKIIKELSVVGKVISFKLLYDRSTGKSKGYGFCEYESPLIAETAIQSLKFSFNGRPVKINYADTENTSKGKKVEIDGIINVIEQMDKDNLEDIIIYLKKMAVDKPTELKKMLNENGNLIVALFHMFLKLNILSQEEIKNILKESFDLNQQKSQIFNRILDMSEDELFLLDDDVRIKIEKIKETLNKNSK